MSCLSLMKQKEVAVGVWPDTTRGAGKAQLNAMEKCQTAKLQKKEKARLHRPMIREAGFR